jgi:hypothetical protein
MKSAVLRDSVNGHSLEVSIDHFVFNVSYTITRVPKASDHGNNSGLKFTLHVGKVFPEPFDGCLESAFLSFNYSRILLINVVSHN